MKKRIFDSFIIKITALIAMTLDHVGALLSLYQDFNNPTLILVFRIIGRLALPLFLFLLFEGMNHSKNKEMYLLRIGILTTVIFVGQLLINLLYMPLNLPNNILDLFLCALFLYFTYHNNKIVKFLAIIPFAYSLMCTVVTCVEAGGEIIVNWLPNYVRCDYGLFAMMFVSLMFLFERIITRKYLKNNKDYTEKMLRATTEYEETKNTVCSIAILVTGALFWIVFTLFAPKYDPFSFGVGVQSYSIIAGIFMLFYNSKLGYHKKWFQYGCYLYFPLHLVVIFVILQLVFYGRVF